MIGRAAVLFAIALITPAAHAEAHGVVGPLDDAVRVAGGLYEIPLRTGPPLLTHGADAPAESGADPRLGAQRPPVCAPDFHQHVLYGRPATAPDRLAAAVPIIEASMGNMNAELDRAALESGGRHADYRVKCNSAGRLAIGMFVNLGSSSFRDVVDAARLGGALDPNADYTIFYDDPSVTACGIGSFSADEQPGAANENNSGGGYAVVYPRCWNAHTVMHENGHNMGAVQSGAPNATVVHAHCRDESDVMCYADGAEGAIGILDRCQGGQRFDCGYDDYFDVAPERGEYLETHWNLGSRANRFIHLSDPLPGEAATPLRCVKEDGTEQLAVDTIGCAVAPVIDEAVPEEEEEEAAPPAVRIVSVSYQPRAARVQVRLACPAPRDYDCRGRVLLARKVSRGVGGRSFWLAPGAAAVVRLPLATPARRAWATGRLRRVWAVAQAEDPGPDAARVVRMSAPARRVSRPPSGG
jgi:hypothetical protein